jgi:hypothetical protein
MYRLPYLSLRQSAAQRLVAVEAHIGFIDVMSEPK